MMSENWGTDLPASRIPISLFREVLIWPLALHLRDDLNDANAMANAVRCTADAIAGEASSWKRIDDPLEHIAPPAFSPEKQENRQASARWRAEAYAEGVYFHEFVQNFLFTKAPDGGSPPPLYLFSRTDIAEVEVGLYEAKPYRLAVERLNLYLFRTGTALLAVEICHQARSGNHGDDTWFLSEVQDFHDRFRRAYIPFANPGEHSLDLPQLVPRSVVWRSGNDAELLRCSVADELTPAIDRYVDPPSDRYGRRFPSVLAHWRWLLPKSVVLPPDEPGVVGRWHHVLDERMATLATVAVAGHDGDELYYYRHTQRGDLVRLCFADGAGGSPYGYDPVTLGNFEKDHTYRLFADRGTLHLSSGYAFVAYGAGAAFEKTYASHMRRHYFQMWLLAQFELATLLTFSSRISHAVQQYDPNHMPEEWFEQRMRVIQQEFLQFVHRFRFTGVSNHVQAQALFSLMRRHLRLDEVFEDIHMEIKSATEFLFNGATARGAETAERLTIIATVAVIAGLAFSALGMNILAQPKPIAYLLHISSETLEARPWAGFAITSGVIATFAGIGGGLLAGLRRFKQHRRGLPWRGGGRPLPFDAVIEAIIWISAAILAGLAGVFGAVAFLDY
jgi:hypothetical protein